MPLSQGEALNQACEGQPALLRNMLAGLVPVVRKVNVGTLSSVAASTTAEQSITVPGLAVGDFVYVTKPTIPKPTCTVGFVTYTKSFTAKPGTVTVCSAVVEAATDASVPTLTFLTTGTSPASIFLDIAGSPSHA